MSTPASTEPSLLRSPLPALALILLVSTSLHLVPQWLAARVEPAWTMIGLMTLDALVVGWLLHSLRTLRLAATAATYWSKRAPRSWRKSGIEGPCQATANTTPVGAMYSRTIVPAGTCSSCILYFAP